MIVKLSLKNVWRNKRRTLITTAVITVGVSMLCLAMAYIEYVKYSYSESVIHAASGHFQVMTRDSLKKEEEKTLAYGIEDWRQVAERVRRDPRVTVVTPRINFFGLGSSGEKSTAVMVQAVLPQNEITMGEEYIDAKPYQALSGNAEGALLGPQLAKSLNLKEGDVLTVMGTTGDGALNAMDFTVVGTYSTGVEELDKRFVLIHLSAAQQLLNSRKVERLAVGLRETRDLPAVMAAVGRGLPSHLAMRTWREVNGDFDKVMNFFFQMIGFMMPVLMLIVWFSTMNTILMSLMERAAEFATLRAMGTSLWRMFKMLLAEGTWIGIIGILLGVGLEILLASLINHAGIMLPPPPGQTSGYLLEVRNTAGIFLFNGVVTFIVVLLSTLVPASRLFRLNIVKALRNG